MKSSQAFFLCVGVLCLVNGVTEVSGVVDSHSNTVITQIGAQPTNPTQSSNGTQSTNKVNAKTGSTRSTNQTQPSNGTQTTNKVNAKRGAQATNQTQPSNGTQSTNKANAKTGTQATNQTQSSNGTQSTNKANAKTRAQATNQTQPSNGTQSTNKVNAKTGSTRSTNQTQPSNGTQTTNKVNAKRGAQATNQTQPSNGTQSTNKVNAKTRAQATNQTQPSNGTRSANKVNAKTGTQATNQTHSSNGTRSANKVNAKTGTQATNQTQSSNGTRSANGTQSANGTWSSNGTDSSNNTSIPDPGDCDFELTTCLWRNEAGDDFDWTRHRNKTPSSGTGPPSDHSGDGHYMYIETSWPRSRGEQARFVGGPFSGTKCMQFFYSMNGLDVADLQVFLRNKESDAANLFLWGKYTNQGPRWHSASITLYGQSYKVMFVGRVGRTYQGDIAIDDITFKNGSCPGIPVNDTRGTPDQELELPGEPGTCSFNSGFCSWINLPIGDIFDWERKKGPTGTKNTGPKEDHSGRNKYYIFAESSEPQRVGHTALLLSPRLCGQLCLQFYYHMWGRRLGSLSLYKREGIKNHDLMWSRTGKQGRNWTEALVDLGGACYQLVLEAVIGQGYLGDIAVDDVLIRKGNCCVLRKRFFDSGEVGNCTFDEDLCRWRNSAEDEFDWTLNEEGTPSFYTGPDSGDNGKGQYIYIESSEPRNNGDKAMLISGDLQGLQCMRFKYHMYGETTGSLAFYLHGNGLMRSLLWKKLGQQGNEWRAGQITLPCQPATYHVEIMAQVGGWKSDIALDNFEFIPGDCPPVSLSSRNVSTTRPPTSPLLVRFEGNCSFPGHFCQWKNDDKDDFDWRIHSGKTPSFQTGPTSDADGNGQYIYIESSLLVVGQNARLISDHMTGTQCMTFKYHMLGEGIGPLTVELKETGSKVWRNKWRKKQNQGSSWHGVSVGVSGRLYQVSLLGKRGTTSAGDISVDAISFVPGSCVSNKDDDAPTNVCSFSSGYCDWENEATTDKFDWTIRSGHTPSGQTGPDSGNGGYGQYAFIESSAPRKQGDNAILKFQGSGAERCLYFFYHMYGAGMGSLNVYQQRKRIDDKPKLLWARRGSNRNAWRRARVLIKAADSYVVLIEGVRGRSYTGDIAIDDVGFLTRSCYVNRNAQGSQGIPT